MPPRTFRKTTKPPRARHLPAGTLLGQGECIVGVRDSGADGESLAPCQKNAVRAGGTPNRTTIRKWRVPRRFLVNRVAGPTGGMFSPPLTMETSRSLATVGQALRPVIHGSNTLHAIVRRELMGLISLQTAAIATRSQEAAQSARSVRY